jgi:hypothetical protein
MGYCCSDRCPNTPHAWQMGWLSVQQLDGHTAAIANSFDAKLTIWRAGLVATQTWSDATTGLVVRVTSISKGSAAITVCRKGGAETLASCQAGLDYNCNGLVGANDPACAKLLQLQNARKKP